MGTAFFCSFTSSLDRPVRNRHRQQVLSCYLVQLVLKNNIHCPPFLVEVEKVTTSYFCPTALPCRKTSTAQFSNFVCTIPNRQTGQAFTRPPVHEPQNTTNPCQRVHHDPFTIIQKGGKMPESCEHRRAEKPNIYFSTNQLPVPNASGPFRALVFTIHCLRTSTYRAYLYHGDAYKKACILLPLGRD